MGRSIEIDSRQEIEKVLKGGGGAKAIIEKLFCNEKVDDDYLFDDNYKCAGRVLQNFVGLCDAEGKISLKGNCFIGVNVKTSSNEPLRPISIRKITGNPDNNSFVADPTCIAEGGRIPDLQEQLQEEFFTWDPSKWRSDDSHKTIVDAIDKSDGAVTSFSVSDDFKKRFSGPYGLDYDPELGDYNPETKKGNKYNIIGEIYYKALKLKDKPCWGWLYHFDYDINNGKYLSFVLAIGDDDDDRDLILGINKESEKKIGVEDLREAVRIADSKGAESPRNQLRNYLMLVKARYVKKLERQRQVEAIKSSVAAIMSRNMSHNLGSHYLYYTRNQLAKLADQQEKFGPDIRGAAKVLGYMQARMDYLATIVSGDKYPYGSVFFKGQIFDELTIDDFSKRHFADVVVEEGEGKDKKVYNKKYKRTTNYLLQNLILSENFTRGPVVEEEGQLNLLDGNNKVIRLQILTKIDGKVEVFTGCDDKCELENAIKLAISKLCIALPGGIMSIHAFFNVIENFIRNSAKYRKEECSKEGLVITIAITELAEVPEEELPTRYRFIIYDNKANAFKPYSANDTTTLVDVMNRQLLELRIFDNKKNELDKSNKGLKEMLFSSLWMRAYTYGKLESLSDILAQMDRMSEQLLSDSVSDTKKEEIKTEKWSEVRKHAFEYVAVDAQGEIQRSKGDGCNLGISFELPKYRMMENVEAEKFRVDQVQFGNDQADSSQTGRQRNSNRLNERLLINKALNNFTDIICVGMKVVKEDGKALGNEPEWRKTQIADLKTVFTRVYPYLVKDENSEKEGVEALTMVLKERFPDFEKYRIEMCGKREEGFANCDPKKHGIYFETHLADVKTMEGFAFSEAVSGENFTKTMQNLYNNGVDDSGVYRSLADKYFGLKIKEAALTRITLVDERLYNDMVGSPDKSEFLKYKNVRVLNLKKRPDETAGKTIFGKLGDLFLGKSDELAVKDVFEGSDFCDGSDETLFLSIHLGMIEKIVKDGSPWLKTFKMETVDPIQDGEEKTVLDQRVDVLMNWLKKVFKTDKGELFISIHSGRGNFSPELDKSLKRYPFISISALESVYSNSKYLLAQLFYNTVYLGKGFSNQEMGS